MTLSLDDLVVVESVMIDGVKHKFSKKEIEGQIRGEMFRRAFVRWNLLTSLRGLTLDEVVEAWWEANNMRGG